MPIPGSQGTRMNRRSLPLPDAFPYPSEVQPIDKTGPWSSGIGWFVTALVSRSIGNRQQKKACELSFRCHHVKRDRPSFGDTRKEPKQTLSPSHLPLRTWPDGKHRPRAEWESGGLSSVSCIRGRGQQCSHRPSLLNSLIKSRRLRRWQ